MRPTVARRWDITDRAISTTVSSWAWVHGQAGAIATVGEAIGSTAMAAEDSMTELAALPIAGMEVADTHHAAAVPMRTQRSPIPVERVQAHLMPLRTTQRRVVTHHTVAAVKLTAVKLTAVMANHTTKAMANMLAAIISNSQLQHQAAEHTCSTALHLADNFATSLCSLKFGASLR